jgi:hypothetical protein
LWTLPLAVPVKSQVTDSPVWISTSPRSLASHVALLGTVVKQGPPSEMKTVLSCAAPATLTPAMTAPMASVTRAAGNPRRNGV